jgi:transcriptional regulator with XRE-family HTH domain
MHLATPGAKSVGVGAHPNNRLPTTTDHAVGRRIRSLRRAAGMTLRDLGEAVGVSGVQFQRYETGASRVAASRLLAICDALGVQVDTLIDEAVPDKEGQRSHARRNECAELARAFNAVADPTHRRAIIALARAFAGRQEHPRSAAKSAIESSAEPEAPETASPAADLDDRDHEQ